MKIKEVSNIKDNNETSDTNNNKEIYITEFQVWNYEDNVNLIHEVIINSINIAEEVYVYRRLTHILEENDFIKWLKCQDGLKYFNKVNLTFREENIVENIIARNNESIYYFKFNGDKKKYFLEHFKISIRDIKNRIGKEKTNKYLEKSIYVDDPMYDQYDFIFTVGEDVILFTDIHDFTFVYQHLAAHLKEGKKV